MTHPPLVLGFDTSGPYCAAALVRGHAPLGAVGEAMARGQAERLMGMLDSLLETHNVAWKDLDALGVGVGPGNFTGIRIGVAAARGLALGLGIPVYAVTGFAARSSLAPAGTTATVPAPRGQVYVEGPRGPALQDLAAVDNPAPDPLPAALANSIALEAARRWPKTEGHPTPYYIRPADAAPARDVPPVIVP